MAVFSVPTGIAHAGICGVEPVYGLYTAIFPSFLYIIFGNSKYNALGGFAILSLMTRSAIEKVERLMAANRYSNYPTPFATANDTALLNDAFNETTSPLWGVSEAILELDLDVGSASTWNSTESAFNGIEEWAEDGTSTRIRPIHIATTIMFMSGIFQILMGLCRLDFLSCYFSEQVMSGFVVGGCVHVFFAQIGDVLGIQLPPRSGRGYLYDV
ncbi:CRE-SULP-3 protein [Aphelenchoides avenae]|nr:CRE-SULP-3 protein [Aphelenchus avenae]